MLILLSTFIVAALLALAILIGLSALNFQSQHDREKHSPFECGFDPHTHSRTPFSLRFFLLAVLFLVFDIEITLLIPIPILIGTSCISYFFYRMFPLLALLILGLFHE